MFLFFFFFFQAEDGIRDYKVTGVQTCALQISKGARLGAARFFSAPTIYGISQGAGGGRTLPLATIASSDVWFGGLALALQQVDASKPPFDQGGGVVLATPLPSGQVAPALPTVPRRPDSYRNQYFFSMAGRPGPRAPAPPPRRGPLGRPPRGGRGEFLHRGRTRV